MLPPLQLQSLENLFKLKFGHTPKKIVLLKKSGGHRVYFRLTDKTNTAIGVWTDDLLQLETFVNFANYFRSRGLPVPEVYGKDEEHGVYLQSDFGPIHLLDLRLKDKAGPLEGDSLKGYQSALKLLLEFQQIKRSEAQELNLKAFFGKQAVLWDLQYFKYYFLQPHQIHFDRQKLEDDFVKLAAWLEQAQGDFFMYRDFQSRNIMVENGAPKAIDFQGGQWGPLQYDVVSLLYQAKAKLSSADRDHLLNFYLEHLDRVMPGQRDQFTKYYSAFVLVRQLQVMGSYGFRGRFEQKPHFLSSIPSAIINLKQYLQCWPADLKLPELKKSLSQLVQLDFDQYDASKIEAKRLNINIQSFSYKRGLPFDLSGNGGGFIFDCRFILNPGRFQPYKYQTGLDVPVQDFLINKSIMPEFIEQVKSMVLPAVENYLERKFESLSICFGCTGGQHRSVFAAETIAAFLTDNYDANVFLSHRESSHWPVNE